MKCKDLYGSIIIDNGTKIKVIRKRYDFSKSKFIDLSSSTYTTTHHVDNMLRKYEKCDCIVRVLENNVIIYIYERG